MAKTIKPADLGKVLEQELTTYHRDVIDRVNTASESTAKALLKKTKRTAPKDTGEYRKSLTYVTKENAATGNKRFIWGAKYPHARLTHLLVHGHAKPDGGRVQGDPFLQNALDEVLPEYKSAVEEAVKK